MVDKCGHVVEKPENFVQLFRCLWFRHVSNCVEFFHGGLDALTGKVVAEVVDAVGGKHGFFGIGAEAGAPQALENIT